MASRQGVFGEFDHGVEDWPSYTERLKQYFAANDIEGEGKHKAILLSCCGPRTYQLIKNLLAPELPTGKSFDEIVQLVKDHLDPKPSVIVQRFVFHSRLRKGGESVAAFVAELRRLSEHCGFGDTLPVMLRDRLVCGIDDGRIQRRLLSKPDLAFKKAFDIAQAMESAERNAQDLQTRKREGIHMMGDGVKPPLTDNVPEIDRVDSFPSNRVRIKHYSQGDTCTRCGGRHQSKDCHFKEVTCFRCQKRGHLARVCRSKPRRDSASINNRRDIHVVSGESEEINEDPLPEYNLYNIRDSIRAPLRIHARVCGVDLEMEIDTGATRSIISKATFERIWIPGSAPTLKKTASRLKTYTGEPIEICGEIEVDVKLERRHAT